METLSEFDKRADQWIGAALVGACGSWLQEARQVCSKAARRINNTVPKTLGKSKSDVLGASGMFGHPRQTRLWRASKLQYCELSVPSTPFGLSIST